MTTQLGYYDATSGIWQLVGPSTPLPVVLGGAAASASAMYSATGAKTDTTPVVKAAAGAGIRNYVTDLTVSNTSATATLVSLLDGAAVIWQGVVPATGSIIVNFATPLRGSANTAMNAQAAVAATTIYLSFGGYTGV